MADTHHAAGQPHFGNRRRQLGWRNHLLHFSLLHFSLFNAPIPFPIAAPTTPAHGVWLAGVGNRLLAPRTPLRLCVIPKTRPSCPPPPSPMYIGWHPPSQSLALGGANRPSPFYIQWVFTIRGAVLCFFNSYSFLMSQQIRRAPTLGKFRASLVISGMPHVAAAYCASNRTVQGSRNRLI